MDIDEMRGNKLGIAAAKEVMGWTEYGVGNDYPLFDAARQKGAIFVLDSPEQGWRQWAPWRDKNDAWEVVEKMRDGGFRFSINDNGNEYAPHWDVRFIHRSSDAAGIGIVGEVPKGILRAALMARRKASATS